MRTIQVSTDVVSVGELKVQAARILKRVNEDRRPIVITQHGKPAAVLVSPADYDLFAERSRFMEAVGLGLSDSEAGRFVSEADLNSAVAEAIAVEKRR